MIAKKEYIVYAIETDLAPKAPYIFASRTAARSAMTTLKLFTTTEPLRVKRAKLIVYGK